MIKLFISLSIYCISFSHRLYCDQNSKRTAWICRSCGKRKCSASTFSDNNRSLGNAGSREGATVHNHSVNCCWHIITSLASVYRALICVIIWSRRYDDAMKFTEPCAAGIVGWWLRGHNRHFSGVAAQNVVQTMRLINGACFLSITFWVCAQFFQRAVCISSMWISLEFNE